MDTTRSEQKDIYILKENIANIENYYLKIENNQKRTQERRQQNPKHEVVYRSSNNCIFVAQHGR